MDPRAPQEASHPARDSSSSDSSAAEEAAEGRPSVSSTLSPQPSAATITPQNVTSAASRSQQRSARNTSQLKLVPIHQFSLRRLNQQHTIRLVGSHVGESSSDAAALASTRSHQSLSVDNEPAIRPQQCLPLVNVVAVREVVQPAGKCQVLENVRGFAQEIEPNDKEEKVYEYAEKAASESATEVGQRHEKEVIELREFPDEPENLVESQKMAKEDSDGTIKEDDPNTTSIEDNQTDNTALAERFKTILEMFDKFTKNLENIDLLGPCESLQRGHSQQRRRDPSPKLRRVCMRAYASDESERQRHPCKVRRSRYEEYYGKAEPMADSSSTPEIEEEARPAPTNESFPYSLDRDERIDMATTMSGIALTPLRGKQNESVAPVKEVKLVFLTKHAECNTVSCQTSQLRIPVIPKAAEPVDDTIIIIEEERKETVAVEIAPAPRSKSEDRLVLVEPRPRTSSPTHLALDNVSLEPMERTYHTIHIDASSSPSSSVMRRPPLCTRLWNVLTDFCAAVCLCLQVNKECFFCLGFLLVFIISATFLSVFFYRTMSAPPTYYTNTHEIVDVPPPRHFDVRPQTDYLNDPIIMHF